MSVLVKKAVVTGGSGFIGQALVRRLISDGADVTAVVRREADFDCPKVVADIRETCALDRLLDEDTVLFHLAGHTSVAGSVKNPAFDFEANVAGTLNILETTRSTGARLVFPSSPAVFAPGQPLPLSEEAYRRPSSPYGAAKLACEGYVQAYHACYEINASIARIFNVYGPGMTRFAIFDFWRKVRANSEEIEILGDGDTLRDYLFIDDAVEALLLIAAHGAAGEDYNVASGIPTRSTDLAVAVARAMGAGGVKITARGQSFPGDIPRWFADISKLQTLGFAPATGLTAGLTSTIEWMNLYATAAR